MDIKIVDESVATERRFQLYVNGSTAALVSKKGGDVQLNWQVRGPQYWPDAKALIQGLLELSIIADKLSGEKNGR